MSDENYGYQVVNPVDEITQQRNREQSESFLQQIMNRGEMLKVIQEYLDDFNIPDDMKRTFWGINSKFLSITFLKPDDEEDLRLLMENSKLTDIMSQPPEDFTWKSRQDYNQLAFLFAVQSRRSMGTRQGVVNERTLQNTQIGHMITTNVGGQQGRAPGLRGTMQKIFG